MKSVATAKRDVNAQAALEMGRPGNFCYSSDSAMESTPTPAETAAGRAGKSILSVSLGFLQAVTTMRIWPVYPRF